MELAYNYIAQEKGKKSEYVNKIEYKMYKTCLWLLKNNKLGIDQNIQATPWWHSLSLTQI